MFVFQRCGRSLTKICARLSYVILVGALAACQPRLEVPETSAGDETPAELPRACFSGTSSLRILVDGKPLRLQRRSEAEWQASAYGERSTLDFSPAPGIEFRFERQGTVDFPEVVGLSLASKVARDVTVELFLAPADLGDDLVWGRSATRPDPAVVTLASSHRPGRRVNSLWSRDTGRLWRWQAVDASVSCTPLQDVGLTSSVSRGFVGELAGVAFRFTVGARQRRDVLEWAYESRQAPTGPRVTTPRSLGGWRASGDVVAAAATLSRLSRQPRMDHRAAGASEGPTLLEMVSYPSLSTIEVVAAELSEGSGEQTVSAVATLAAHGFRVSMKVSPFGVSRSAAAPFLDGKPFVQDSKSRPITGGVLGDFVWDPTTRSGREGLRRQIVGVLARLGDASAVSKQPCVLRVSHVAEALAFYRRHARTLASVRSGAPTKLAGETALRTALEVVRSAVGDGCVLAGDWNTPPEAAGLLEFCRPRLYRSDGGDLLRRDALCTLREYPFHDLAWSCEGLNFHPSEHHPGGLGHRSAFRAMVDLRVLTGRSFFFQGAPEGLVERRWSMIREALPPLDCRLLDLMNPGASDTAPPNGSARKVPPVWLLDPGVPGAEAHDVIGVFNFNPFAPERITISLSRLGWPASDSQSVLVFDRHSRSFLGTVSESFDLLLPPRSSRLLSLHGRPLRPVVVADARYLVDGQRSIDGLEWRPESRELSFSVQPQSGRNVTPAAALHLALPEAGPNRVVSHRANNGQIDLEREGRHQILRIRFDGKDPEAPVQVRLVFGEDKRAGRSRLAVPAPRVRARFDRATGGVWLEWDAVRSGLAALLEGYEVQRNGEVVGRTFDQRFLDLPELRAVGHRDRYSVAIRWRDPAVPSRPRSEAAFVWPSEDTVNLSELAPQVIEQSWGYPGRDRGADGRPLRLGGQRIDSGIGVAVPSRLEYDLRGRFRRLRLRVGIDTGAGLETRARFRLELDGKTLFESEPMRYGDDAAAVDVQVAGGRRLVLVAATGTDVAQTSAVPTAVWANGVLEP